MTTLILRKKYTIKKSRTQSVTYVQYRCVFCACAALVGLARGDRSCSRYVGCTVLSVVVGRAC